MEAVSHYHLSPFSKVGVVGWWEGAGWTFRAGHPTGLMNSSVMAYFACSRCGWGCLHSFSLSSIFSLFFFPLWETARYRLKYCLKEPKPPTYQPFSKAVNSCRSKFFPLKVDPVWKGFVKEEGKHSHKGCPPQKKMAETSSLVSIHRK